MHNDSTLQVDLGAIGHNVGVFSTLIGARSSICGVIKANAYGLGAASLAPVLRDAGCSMLAVFRVEEAIEVLQSAGPVSVLVLGPTRDLHALHPLVDPLRQGLVHLVVHDHSHARALSRMAREQGVTWKVHLEVDTGLSRGGCLVHETAELIHSIMADESLELAGIMTHYASAGTNPTDTKMQFQRFSDALMSAQSLPSTCTLHAAATSGSLQVPESHMDMIRIGLGWCGVVPGDPSLQGHLPTPLRSAIRWSSHIAQIKVVAAGQPVGYGGLWTPGRQSTLAIVPVGYADGVPIQAGRQTGDVADRAVVAVSSGDGNRSGEPICFAPVVGAVSMDQMMIDLTDAPGLERFRLGHEVELVSANNHQPTSLWHVAQRCGLTPHQLLTGIGAGVRRQFVQRPETVASPMTMAV